MAPWTSRLVSNPASSARDGTSDRESRDNIPPHIRSGQGIYVPVPKPAAATPSASSPPQSRRPHLRSASNPFPSLFGQRKSPGPKNEPHPLQNAAIAAGELHGHPSGLSRSVSPHKPPRGSEENWTRRCMTCDHTNSFAKGRNGFRCGKCAMINDLEPYDESSTLRVPEHGFDTPPPPPPPPRREESISVERTRAIIDRCIALYLQTQLNAGGKDDGSLLDGHGHRSPKRDGIAAGDGCEDCSFDKPELITQPIATTEMEASADNCRRADIGLATPMLSPDTRFEDTKTSVPRGYETPPRHHRQRSYDHQLTPTATPPQQSSRRGSHDRATGFDTSRSATIFGQLERYILAHFDGCGSLNSSFLARRPHHPRTASGEAEGDFGKYKERSRSPIRDVPELKIDEQALQVGDVAESSSWWPEDHPKRRKSHDDGKQADTSESRPGSISMKSPRIIWPEVAEWYKLILHAGENWFDMWAEMKPAETENPTLIKIWNQTDTSALDQMIHQSRLRLRTTLLRATEKLLQRPKRHLRRPGDVRFILILLENPLLYPSNGYSTDMAPSALAPPRPAGRSKSDDSAAMNDNNKVRPPIRSVSSSTPVSERNDYRTHIIKRAMGLLAHLSSECHLLLVSWFSRLSDSHFRRLVELIGTFVSHRLTKQRKRRSRRPTNTGNNHNNIDEFVPTYSASGNTTSAQLHTALNRDKTSRRSTSEEGAASYGDDWQLKAAARVMALLFRANYGNTSRRSDHKFTESTSQTPSSCRTYGVRIPISTFYSTMLDYFDLIADFESWESRDGSFSFCQYSFFLSIWAKIRILEHDARRQMEAKAREAFFDTILGRAGVSQYLVLKIRRDCLVEDSLRGVSEVVGSAQEEIKKGLRIEFSGEPGVDAGGIRKEWFLLLAREIFDPNHALFIYDEDSQLCYFNPYCFESSEQFFLVGVLLGLAIYNSTILDIALPAFAFRKLLASSPSNTSVPALSTPPQSFRCSLEDLAEYRPALAKGLRQLLEYEGEVEETFCLSFVAHQERYGEAVEVPLCPGGENRAVTNYNRREYVDLYVKYLLNDAVSRQFEPFKRGFFTVCGGNALHLFRPEEIELLVRGSDESLDIPSLRAVAVYEHWPVTDPDKEPVVQWFWAFFARMSPGDQRKLLSFITGSDRVPAMGATNLIIRLVCLGQDSERFPTARTCFNMVALYRYRTREKLEKKLWRAVSESEGFGLK